jgi:serine/threonine protein kinase
MSPERINSAPYSYPADIWSLGLAMYESAMGHYPYDATVGPLQLMIQVVEEPSPVPPREEFSEEFRDFVAKCLMKDPLQRPTAEDLLQHPYIIKVTKIFIAHTSVPV